jgi:hypothetical protein
LKVISKIFRPHSPKQRQIMEYLAGSGPPFTMWVSCGTKFGKTIGACGGVGLAVPNNRGELSRIVAPIYKQVKISWKYLDQIWPGEPYVIKNKGNMEMYLPGVKSTLQFWHGQNPEDLEGEGVARQLNDECAKLRQQVFDSSRTTMTRTMGRMQNISTPRGRNWFFRGYTRALEEMERAAYEKRTPKEIALTATTAENPFVSQEAILEAKRLLPERLFRQYYLAEFLEDGMVFPAPVIDTEFWPVKFVVDGPVQSWMRGDYADLNVVAGCDWAKQRDFTVLTAWDYSKRPFRMVGFMRLQGMSYPDQVVEVVRFLRKYKSCEMLKHDKTGVGIALDDMLEKVPDLVYEGVTFSNATKAFMVNDLIMLMERREILFPWWQQLMDEFDNFEVQVSDIGNMIYKAADGFHDDIVFSCALGMIACLHYADATFEAAFLEELPFVKPQIDTIEHYMLENLDIDPDEGF